MTFPTTTCECGETVAVPQLRRHQLGERHSHKIQQILGPKRRVKHRDKPRTISKKHKPKTIEITHKTIDPNIPTDPIMAVVDEILELFKKKNAEYTGGRDMFYNFDSAAPVTKGIMSPFTYCMTLSDKQHNAMWVALAPHSATLTKNSTVTSNIRERLFDQAVYAIIGLALLDRGK